MKNDKLIKSANDEIITRGNLDAVGKFFTSDYVVHSGAKEHKGHKFIAKFIGQLRSAIPDIKVKQVEFLMQSKDRIVWQRTLSGTHKAEMMGIPAGRKKVKWTEMFISRINGGKIAEEWAVSELAGELFSKLPRT